MTTDLTWADYSTGGATPPPAELVAALAAHVSASTSDAFVGECVSTALGLVGGLLDGVTATIPVEVLDHAVVEVGADLFHRRTTRNGIATFGDGLDVPPMRIRRDPLDAARPLLHHWLPGGFA